MSELNVTTISSRTVGTAPVINDSAGTEVGQLCSAWVTFVGTGTIAISDNFNVSSLTDNGTGDYTVNFAATMANSDFVVAGSGKFDSANSSGDSSQVGLRRITGNPTTTTARITTSFSTGTTFDCEIASVAFFGGLA